MEGKHVQIQDHFPMHKDSAFVDVCPQNVYHQHQETAQYETL